MVHKCWLAEKSVILQLYRETREIFVLQLLFFKTHRNQFWHAPQSTSVINTNFGNEIKQPQNKKRIISLT
jgi:hypothetical protein